MKDKISLAIADDQDIILEGMQRIMGSQPDIEIVAASSVLPEAENLVRIKRPDVLLLDIKWHGDEQAGVDAIKRLRRDAPETRIVAITVYEHLVRDAKQAGAHAVVLKSISRRQLIEEIRQIAQQPAASPASAIDTPPAPEPLSTRELQVLNLLAEGKSDREVAEELNIAESTAKNHVSSILGKLGVNNRAAAVALGIRRNLVDSR